MIVKGVCSPEFQKVKDIFQSYFDEDKEIGANFALVKKNKVLINIYGGLKNSKEEWDENTIVNTFSVSKGVYASCVARLVEEKELNIDKKVSFYWPEFKNNKEDIKVKDILSHRSGLYRFKTKVTNSDLLDFDKLNSLIRVRSLVLTSGSLSETKRMFLLSFLALNSFFSPISSMNDLRICS